MTTPNTGDWKNVFFVGIGGIGMSAIARWFHVNGFDVAGYDKTPTVLTQTLQEEGIPVCFDDDTKWIPDHFRKSREETLVVYTPAIPADQRQLAWFREQGYTIQKRSQVLGWLTGNLKTIGVAGTHGKTTTSSMVAHILKHGGANTAAFLGGITRNYGTNFLLNEPAENPSDIVCVVEADEFDRSFLTLFPEIGIVTSTDADHLDIYGAHDALLDSFRKFVSQIRPNGVLFLRKGLSIGDAASASVFEYSLSEGSYHASGLRIEDGRFKFTIETPSGPIDGIALMMPGFHNVENAVAAAAAAQWIGLTPLQIKEGLNSYQGVKRRFELVLESPRVLIDDYAHHPTEINAFLSGVRSLYPNRHITAVFQPHLFTRTRDFAQGFADSLSQADRLLLLEIYPAREKPIDGVNSSMLLEMISIPDKHLVSDSELISKIRGMDTDIIVTIGAGDIDKLVLPLRDALK